MYLTIEQLGSRYGWKEIIAITNDRVSAPVTEEALKAYVIDGDVSPTDDILAIVAVVQDRIRDAESFVLSYIGATYSVLSFTEENVPNVVRAVTAAVARYYLHENRMTQRVHQGYEDAERWLIQAQKGVNALGVSEDDTESKRIGVTSAISTADVKSRVFTPRSEDRFTEGY